MATRETHRDRTDVDAGLHRQLVVWIEIVQRLADAGKGVIVISSELPELLGICDRIYTIFEGEITGEFDRSQATQESLMRLMTGSTQTPTH